MDKESQYELQKIDCSCNDCGFMVRDLDKMNASYAEMSRLSEDLFDLKKGRYVQKAKDQIARNKEKGEAALRDAMKMKFTPPGKSAVMYGACAKFNKEITFLSGVLSIENQACFVHRKDLK